METNPPQNCGGVGHDTKKCKRLLGVRKEWVPKRQIPLIQNQVQTDIDGFITQPRQQLAIVTTAIEVGNAFQALKEHGTNTDGVNEPLVAPMNAGKDSTQTSLVENGMNRDTTGGGEPPPVP